VTLSLEARQRLFRAWVVSFTAVTVFAGLTAGVAITDLHDLVAAEEREDVAEREADCRRSLEVREASAASDVALVRDMADAVLARDPARDSGALDALVADIGARITARMAELPPPAVCVPNDEEDSLR
jgi:hypothetical protein